MTAFPPVLPGSDESAVVARLRAAGCVFAEDEARLLVTAARTAAELEAMVLRRVEGLPLEHILGWAAFCGLRIGVDPGVFVPRVRTEFMVHQAADLARALGRNDDGGGLAGRDAAPNRDTSAPPAIVVVDLCCGSGAVGAALTAALAGAGRAVELYAADIEPAAVSCARRNIGALGGQVFHGDLFAPLPARLRGRVDILLANTPYVPTEEIALMPPEARLHEPRVTLDGGADGLDIQRRVAAEAPSWLVPGGHLLVESSERQGRLSAETFAVNGLLPRVVTSEELYATIVIGTKPR